LHKVLLFYDTAGRLNLTLSVNSKLYVFKIPELQRSWFVFIQWLFSWRKIIILPAATGYWQELRSCLLD